MTAKIISGNEVAKEIRAELKERATKLKERGITPGLVMIRVGEDPASVSYVSGKEKAAEEIGVWTQTLVLPENAPEKELLAKVKEMMEADQCAGDPPDGKHGVRCGPSNIVGKPLMAMLVQKNKRANATVTVVHTGTKNMAEITRQADILVAAMGSPEVIKADMVKEGAVVIDVGVNRVGWKQSKTDPTQQRPDLG